jgi:hypothetical protein
VQLVVLSVAETAITIMAASIPILRALSRDKGGPGGIKMFALNATQHLTLRRSSAPLADTPDVESGKTGETSRRLFRLMKKASSKRTPVLSKIIETDELSPGLFGGITPRRETSFV